MVRPGKSGLEMGIEVVAYFVLYKCGSNIIKLKNRIRSYYLKILKLNIFVCFFRLRVKILLLILAFLIKQYIPLGITTFNVMKKGIIENY